MSCLSKRFRLNKSKDFGSVYKIGKKWHTKSFVTFYQEDTELKLAFVASKKVGGAVVRNRTKRRVRAILLKYEDKIKIGKYIFVVKNTILERTYKDLEQDLKFAIKKLELFK